MKSKLSISVKVIPENKERLKTKKNIRHRVKSIRIIPNRFNKPEILNI